jgi:hypothetical protein
LQVNSFRSQLKSSHRLFSRGSRIGDLNRMRVIRTCCAQGAREASGLAVIIDVFRAFSCEPLFFHLGAAKVILEPDPARASAMKQDHPELVLVGEVNEVPIEGADLGNSPSEILLKSEGFFRNKTVIHRTTAGVTGAAAALERADEVILGSFMTAKAVATYIGEKSPALVTLVAMGERASKKPPRTRLARITWSTSSRVSLTTLYQASGKSFSSRRPRSSLQAANPTCPGKTLFFVFSAIFLTLFFWQENKRTRWWWFPPGQDRSAPRPGDKGRSS